MAADPKIALSVNQVSKKESLEDFTQKVLSDDELRAFAKNSPDELRELAKPSGVSNPKTAVVKFNLGSCYEIGLLPDSQRNDKVQRPNIYRSNYAYVLHSEALTAGLLEAYISIGLFYLNFLYEDCDHIRLRFSVNDPYYKPTIKVIRDFGIKYLEHAAEKGDPRAQTMLADFMLKDLANHHHFLLYEHANGIPPYPHSISELYDGSLLPGSPSEKLQKILNYLKAAAHQNDLDACVGLGRTYLNYGVHPTEFFDLHRILSSTETTPKMDHSQDLKYSKDLPRDLKCSAEAALDQDTKELHFFLHTAKQYSDFYVNYRDYLVLFWFKRAKFLGSVAGHFYALVLCLRVIIPKTIDNQTRIKQYQSCLNDLEQLREHFITAIKQFKEQYERVVADLKLRLKLETCDFGKLSTLELQEIEAEADKSCYSETHYLLGKLYKLNQNAFRLALSSAAKWFRRANTPIANPRSAFELAEWLNQAAAFGGGAINTEMLGLWRCAADQGNSQAAYQYALGLVNTNNLEFRPDLAYRAYAYFKIAEFHGMEIPQHIICPLEKLIIIHFNSLQAAKLNILKVAAKALQDPENRRLLTLALDIRKFEFLRLVLERIGMIAEFDKLPTTFPKLRELNVHLNEVDLSQMIMFTLCREILMESSQRLAFAMGLHQRLGQDSQTFRTLKSSEIFDRKPLLLMFEMAGMPRSTMLEWLDEPTETPKTENRKPKSTIT